MRFADRINYSGVANKEDEPFSRDNGKGVQESKRKKGEDAPDILPTIEAPAREMK